MEAMLLCSGELGYRRVAVERVYRYYGGYRSQFYRYFRNKAHCFVSAYETEAGRLTDRVVARFEGEGPIEDRLLAGLGELAAFVVERPTAAKALFVEVHLAGREALARRQEILERLSRALDDACRQIPSGHSPPPTTAEFMISAIDQAVSSALLSANPQAFAATVPDLVALICHAYYGGDTPLA